MRVGIAVWMVLLAVAAQGQVAIVDHDRSVSIENALIKVTYDLGSNLWRAEEIGKAKNGFRDAAVCIDNYNAQGPEARASWTQWDVSDALGVGKTLAIRIEKPGQPAILFDVTLYDGKGYITFSAGIENTTDRAVTIHRIDPMRGAWMVVESNPSDPKTLNGTSGATSTSVRKGADRSSSNNVLLTYKAGGRRRSLVLGGLTYQDWAKYAGMGNGSRESGVGSRKGQSRDPERETAETQRGKTAENAEKDGSSESVYLDCGVQEKAEAGGITLRVVSGKPFTWADDEGDPVYASVLYDEKEIAIEVAGLNAERKYTLGFSWWDYDNNGRIESVTAIADDGRRFPLVEARKLPAYLGAGQRPDECTIALPREAYATGKVRIMFGNVGGTVNAVVSSVWVSDVAGPDKPRFISVESTATKLKPGTPFPIGVWAEDPVGRRVEAGERYPAGVGCGVSGVGKTDRRPEKTISDLRFQISEGETGIGNREWGVGNDPEPPPNLPLEGGGVGEKASLGGGGVGGDRFYVDFVTRDPFAALEQYAQAVALAQGVRINPYTFPTVCAWYVEAFQRGEKINNTAGLVDEMDKVAASGFLRYSTVALRLVPDTYGKISEQGWWDDEHWRRFGHYTAPYETSRKFCDAIRERGGLPFTYFQTCYVSEDYATAHPDQVMLYDASGRLVLDATASATQAHMREVWANLKDAGIAGLMFDYPETGWIPGGGFEDPQATAASAYRTWFALCREGLGPKALIHERILGEQGKPTFDIAAGLVDSQRVWWDASHFEPEMVRRCALRWYKSRVLFAYDTDSKNFFPGGKPMDRVALRGMLTMLYVTSGRLLMANSFRDLTPEQLYDLSRTFPYPTEGRSARPVDAFVTDGCPRVYDYAITPQWHQVTLYNPDTKRAKVGTALSGDQVDGGLGLKAGSRYYVYDFWGERLVGALRGKDRLELDLAPGEAVMLSVREVLDHPQVLSTNRHIMQGYLDMPQCEWDPVTKTLAGTSLVVGGEAYKVIIALNGYEVGEASVDGGTCSVRVLPGGPAELAIECPENATVRWEARMKDEG